MSIKPKIYFVPWDPDSPHHVTRLYDQRIACGWKFEKIEIWRTLQRAGKMTIQWIALSENSPTTSSLLTTHTARYPAESTPLTDTAATFNGQPRLPPADPIPIHPIGHISLDSWNPDSPHLADPDLGIYCISTFYISTALQSAGLGRAAMSAIEAKASSPPLNAKVLALNTLAKEQYERLDMWAALGKDVPPIGLQEWYERRGYRVFDRNEKAFREVDAMGREWWMADVFMRKEIV